MALQSPEAIELKRLLHDMSSAGSLYTRLDDNRLECYACGHLCKIAEGKEGVCRVRYQEDGVLRVPGGYVASLACDPIEKKPFFHAFVGRPAMSFGMLGCDLHCGYCQNWVTSQAMRDDNAVSGVRTVSAKELADAAVRYGAPVITSTYNEPLITAEWALEVFSEAQMKGVLGAFVSNGNATEKVLDFLKPYVNLYKVDLKSFQDREYRKLGGQLENVRRTIRQLHERGIWLEVVTLSVPGLNDSDDEFKEMAEFLVGISPDIPWHITAFHSDYKMQSTPDTEADRLISACEIGTRAGLRYVYAGNRPGRVGELENTRCHHCNATVIRRQGFRILENRLVRGWCPDCGGRVPGFWARDCVVPQEGAGQSAWLQKHPEARA